MLPKDYIVKNDWKPIQTKRNKKAGEIKLYIANSVKGQWKRSRKDNLDLLHRMAEEIAKRATDFSRRDWEDYVFGYGERQLDSILVPALWDIVEPDDGLVLAQFPTERHKMIYPSKTHKGWVDYRVKKRRKIHILEIKLAPSSEKLNSKNIIDEWHGALEQLNSIRYKRQVRALGGGCNALFTTAILFIPIFVKSKDEKDNRLKNKDNKSIEKFLDVDALLGQFKKKEKPDWMTCWLLPKTLQDKWEDTESGDWWQSPAVLILARLNEKWRNQSGNWSRDKTSV